MDKLKELSQWLEILLAISAVARVACMIFLPGDPANFVAAGLLGVFLFAFAAVWLARLVLHLLGRHK